MTFGSLVWGQAAQLTSTRFSLAAAASLGALVALLAARARLPVGEDDLSPAMHWPQPAAAAAMPADAGPVMVTVEYRIAPHDAAAFERAVQALGVTRRRDGAYAWGVFQDTEDPELFLEYFIVQSWVEHMRQHERISRADEALQAKVRELHKGTEPPQTSHLIALGQGAVTVTETRHADRSRTVG
jgi:quinol monooxygenase YgiN